MSQDIYAEDIGIQHRPTRVKTGCLTCRQRKKKCNHERPRCGHCERLNLICRWEEPRDPLHRRPSRQRNGSEDAGAMIRAPDPTLFWIDQIPSDGNTKVAGPLNQRAVLRYYMQTFTLTLTTTLSNNGFLSVFLPMALESDSIRDALLGLAASHLALCHPMHEPLALQSRSQAFSSLSRSLSGIAGQCDRALAACLALCSMEAILGDTSSWYQHLSGASLLINKAENNDMGTRGPEAIASSFEGRWLLRNFAYHDILMSVTLNQAPLIQGDYWMFEQDDLVDSYFGLATIPMITLSKISSMNAMITQFRSMSAAQIMDGMETLFIGQALRLESDLNNWKCPPSEDSSLMCLAETYRCAASIHLLRICRIHRIQDLETIETKIDQHVSGTLTAVKQMPAECLPECTLLFPLFMAGGETSNPEQAAFIRNRLVNMERFRRFRNVAVALEVLEELWKQNHVHECDDTCTPRSPSSRTDWLDILSERDWKLALS